MTMSSGSAQQNYPISVVVPVHNSDRYLDAFLRSLQAQTFQGFRLYLVDDASTDRSAEIIERYRDAFGGRMVCRRLDRNVGVGPARNAGLEMVAADAASGSGQTAATAAGSAGTLAGQGPKYLAFLDSDDWMEPEYLRDLYEAAEQYDADLTVSGLTRFDDESGREICVEMIHFPSHVVTDLAHCDDLGYVNTCLYSKLYRYDKVRGIRFRNMERSEDTCFLFEAIPRLECVKFTNHAYYHYRVWLGSRSTLYESSFTRSMYENFADMLAQFNEGDRRRFRPLLETQVFIRTGIGSVCRDSFRHMPAPGADTGSGQTSADTGGAAASRGRFGQGIPTKSGSRMDKQQSEFCPTLRAYLRGRRYMRAYEKEALEFMDTHMPEWRTNPYMNFTKGFTLSPKKNAVKACALLYKMHLFRVFIRAYYILSQVMKKDVRL